MKLTKSRLRKMIREEFSALHEMHGGDPDPTDDGYGDEPPASVMGFVNEEEAVLKTIWDIAVEALHELESWSPGDQRAEVIMMDALESIEELAGKRYTE